jgi:hypothetical protein
LTGSLVLGSFKTPEAVLAAAEDLRRRGHRDLDAYSAYPLEGAEEALDLPRTRMPRRVLAGGLLGATTGLGFQWWCNAIDFPINVGGRPLFSLPSWIPITFELTVLFGAFGAFFGLLSLLGLPRLHHPVFEVPGFRSVAVDRFWLSAPAGNLEEVLAIEAELQALGAEEISVLEDAE